ncbi:hypothetical protein AcW1_003848 [Taiwanofungus camphoratus]|nr:hypothetical protein AcW1_003848 [Antrodia cinnamomea]
MHGVLVSRIAIVHKSLCLLRYRECLTGNIQDISTPPFLSRTALPPSSSLLTSPCGGSHARGFAGADGEERGDSDDRGDGGGGQPGDAAAWRKESLLRQKPNAIDHASAPPSPRANCVLGGICCGMSLPDTLACAATVTVCNVQPHGRRKKEQSQNTPAPAAPLLSTYVHQSAKRRRSQPGCDSDRTYLSRAKPGKQHRDDEQALRRGALSATVDSHPHPIAHTSKPEWMTFGMSGPS